MDRLSFLAKMYDLPTTNEEAIEHLRGLVNDKICQDSLIGIFRCRIAQGDDLYSAFATSLLALISDT